MLKPSMQELLGKVSNRYLLVNLAAQRARDLSDEVEEIGTVLSDKPVKLALDEIAEGSVEYRTGPRVPEVSNPVLSAETVAAMLALEVEDSAAVELFGDE